MQRNTVIEKQVAQEQRSSACTLTALATLALMQNTTLEAAAKQLDGLSKQSQQVFEDRNKKVDARERSGLYPEEAKELLPRVVKTNTPVYLGKLEVLSYQSSNTNQARELTELVNSYFSGDADTQAFTMDALLQINGTEDIVAELYKNNKNAALAKIKTLTGGKNNPNQNNENNQRLKYRIEQEGILLITEGHTIAMGKKDQLFFSFDSNTGILRTSADVDALIASHANIFVRQVQLSPFSMVAPKTQLKNQSAPAPKENVSCTVKRLVSFLRKMESKN